MGVAKCTASRIPSMEFPDMTKAKREPACGARKTAPVWGEEKAHSPVNRKKTVTTNTSQFYFFSFMFTCLACLSWEFQHETSYLPFFSDVYKQKCANDLIVTNLQLSGIILKY